MWYLIVLYSLTITCGVVWIEFVTFIATTFIRRRPIGNGASTVLCTIICHTILAFVGICSDRKWLWSKAQRVENCIFVAIIAERLSARQLILLSISFCVGMYVDLCMCVCPSRLGMLIFLCAAVRWVCGTRTRPHYCCHISMASMMNRSVSLLQQRWIIGPTEDEDDRLYGRSRKLRSPLSSVYVLCLLLGSNAH